MDKKLLWGILIVAAILVIGVVAFNSTLTGQATISSPISLSENDVKVVTFNDIAYRISDVSISATKVLTFRITSDQTRVFDEISGEKNSKHAVSGEIGPIEVLISDVGYDPAEKAGERGGARIVFYKK